MPESDRTILFLDLTRFTNLTDVHGDEKAAEVVERFLTAVDTALSGRGRLVKTLGDGVLADMTDPRAAIVVADEISQALHEQPAMPQLTGGISTGPVLERGDDVLGSTVNLAARLADLAPAGELRMTSGAARAAADAGWRVEPLGPVEVRGFHDPIDVFAVTLRHPVDFVTDPVCGMRLSPGPDTPTVIRRSVTHWFCSPPCAARFRATPGRYGLEP